MGKELDKFEKLYDKLVPRIKAHEKKDAQYKVNEINTYYNRCKGYAEEEFTDAIVDAREEGVTGTKITDLMKDQGIKKALKTYMTPYEDFTDALKSLQTLGKEAMAVYDEMKKMRLTYFKDVALNKATQEKKSDIDKFTSKIDKTMQNLKEAVDVSDSIPKVQLEYAKNRDANLNLLIKNAPQFKIKKPVDVKLPEELEQRTLDKARTLSVKLVKNVAGFCDTALKNGGEPKKAEAAMKLAEKSLDELKTMVEDQAKALKPILKELRGTKQLSKILGNTEPIARSLKAAIIRHGNTEKLLKKMA